jgi:hypothetical protein
MKATALAAAALLVVSVSTQEPTRVAPRREATMRPEILGTHGIVAGGRRQRPGSADPQRAPADVRLRQADSGSD